MRKGESVPKYRYQQPNHVAMYLVCGTQYALTPIKCKVYCTRKRLGLRLGNKWTGEPLIFSRHIALPRAVVITRDTSQHALGLPTKPPLLRVALAASLTLVLTRVSSYCSVLFFGLLLVLCSLLLGQKNIPRFVCGDSRCASFSTCDTTASLATAGRSVFSFSFFFVLSLLPACFEVLYSRSTQLVAGYTYAACWLHSKDS